MGRSESDGAQPGGHEVERLDLRQLGDRLRDRRGPLSIRRAAADAGVSFSTFSRVEGGAHPDMASFIKLCAWLGDPPSRFFSPVAARESQPVEAAVRHLLADPRLSKEAAAKIGGVLRDMYDALAKSAAPPTASVACHLRATSVMRPGVPERLASLLTDMHAALADRVEQASR